jgi:hypothetical protein
VDVTAQHGQSNGRPRAPTAVAQSFIAIASMTIKFRRHDRRRRSRVWSWNFSGPKLTNNRLFDCNAQLTTRVEEAYDTIGVNMPKLSFKVHMQRTAHPRRRAGSVPADFESAGVGLCRVGHADTGATWRVQAAWGLQVGGFAGAGLDYDPNRWTPAAAAPAREDGRCPSRLVACCMLHP